MPESKRTESLGARLLAVGRPQEVVWDRYKETVERAMSELEKRIRRAGRLRWIALGVYGLYVLVGAFIFLRFSEPGDVVQLAVFGVWAAVVVVLGVFIVLVFHVERTHLDVRRDVKELTLAVMDLKDAVSSRAV